MFFTPKKAFPKLGPLFICRRLRFAGRHRSASPSPRRCAATDRGSGPMRLRLLHPLSSSFRSSARRRRPSSLGPQLASPSRSPSSSVSLCALLLQFRPPLAPPQPAKYPPAVAAVWFSATTLQPHQRHHHRSRRRRRRPGPSPCSCHWRRTAATREPDPWPRRCADGGGDRARGRVAAAARRDRWPSDGRGRAAF